MKPNGEKTSIHIGLDWHYPINNYLILGKKKYLKDLSIEVYGSMISAALIAISFFVFSDFFFEPPNLNGKWFTVIKTENSSLDRFVGMMLIYEIILFQDDDNLYGTAEKISEIVDQKKYDYAPDKRVRIEFKGIIDRKYFTKDILYLHWSEEGRRRTTSSYFEITRFNDNYMFGIFNSTAAESNGKSEWVRDLSKLKEMIL